MAALKGGRGKKAPWETVMVRCPEPIKNEVQNTIDSWKQAQIDPEHKSDTQPVTAPILKPIVDKVLRQKKSARVSVIALLVELGYDVSDL